ncbi:MAG: Rrf2 family transcriptional regulator [Verrucomicrobia bacterium]|nr:MAG: Rrf2 family transcriptional regulator [Verrucomicrobiota bacterium]
MQFTRASEYGVFGLLNLARRGPGATAMVEEVGRQEAIPPDFLAKIFRALARAGLVRSVRGAGGGFTLQRPPERITLLEVVEAVDGPIHLQPCFDPSAGCAFEAGCALCEPFAEARRLLRETLARHTLAELARRQSPRAARLTAAHAAR